MQTVQQKMPGQRQLVTETPRRAIVLCITYFPCRYWKNCMTEAEAKAFVVKALGYAMARDASSGGCIRTVTIDKEGVRRDFIPGTDVPVCYGEMPKRSSVVA